MRVVIADTPSYTLPYDHALAAALAERGHDVDLLASPFRFARPPEPIGYRRHDLFLPLSGKLFRRRPRSRLRLVVKALEYPASVRRLVRTIRALAPDVVHVQWIFRPGLDVRWLRVVARDRPMVFTLHAPAALRPARVPRWLEVLRAADRVVVHSSEALERVAALGLESDRVVRIPHPVFLPPGGQPLPPPTGNVLLFFGLIRSYKGVDVLLRALELVSQEIPDVRLVVAGDPLDPVEPLRRLAADLGISDRVEWCLRYLSESDLAEALAPAAAVVLPYRPRSDASGVLAAALGYGRPVIVSDVGALGETVREFEAGEVVPPEDIEALAAACVRLLRYEGALAAAFRGTQAAREELTWARAAEAHERLYGELLAERRRLAR